MKHGLLPRNRGVGVEIMPKKQNASVGWAEVKKHLKSFDEHQVFDLIKGLFPVNQFESGNPFEMLTECVKAEGQVR